MKNQTVKTALFVFLTLLAIFVFWQVRQIIVYILFSLFFGATLRPISNLTSGRKTIVRILIYAGCALCLFGLVYFTLPALEKMGSEINLLINTISHLDNWYITPWLGQFTFIHTLLEMLPAPGTLFNAGTADGGLSLLPFLQTTSQDLLSLLSGTFVVIFLSLYWMGSSDHFERLWLSLLRISDRQRAHAIWRKVDAAMGSYGQLLLVQFFLTWLVLGVGFYYLRSPYPVFTGLLVALVNLFPIIGIILSLVVTLFIGLLSSITFTPWLLAFVLLTLLVLRAWVWPRFFKHKWDSPILSIVVLIAISEAFGLRWLLLGPPIAAILQILFDGLVEKRKMQEESVRFIHLQERRIALEQTIASMQGEIPPALLSNLERLDVLLSKAKTLLEGSEH